MILSPHFRLDEFTRSQVAARYGIDNSPNEQQIDNLRMLCDEILEPLRTITGPIQITSGFRCPELNARVGGSPHSQHLHGLAADIVLPHRTPVEVCNSIIAMDLMFDQVIHEFGQWTHVSVPASGKSPRRQLLTIDRRGTRTGILAVRA